MFIRYNFFTAIWLGLVIVMTLITNQEVANEEYPHFEKVIHAVMFCVLSFFLIIGFTKQDKYSRLRFRAVRYALLASLIIAIAIESLQIALPERTFYLYDLVSDVIGAFVGYYVFVLIYKVL